MTANQGSRRISKFPGFFDQNGNLEFNSNSTIYDSIASNSTIQTRPILNNIILHENSCEPSTSNNNSLRLHIRDASTLITGQQPPTYENVRRRRYLMESKAALYLPPVATFLCSVLITLYFFREYLNVFAEDDIYVSWKKVIEEKQIWRLFVAQFFHFSRASVIVSVFTLYAIGRYLERKVTSLALLSVIMVMSVLSHILYIFLSPFFSVGEHSEFIWGFGNVVYSLRVMLAYALEPRNHERDLVFGLYPMVLSANAAPWQPVLDLIIFKIVLPEQCITGQLSGILAGFIVTFFLLVWPTEGIYIANPPYFWVADPEPNDPNNGDGEGGIRWRRSSTWRMETYPSRDFFISPPSDTTIDYDTAAELNQRQAQQMKYNNELIPITNANVLHRNSNELKQKISQFFVTARESLIKKFGKGDEEKEEKSIYKHCKLIHKRRRKKGTKRIEMKMKLSPRATTPINERSRSRSSGSVSSIDPDYLSGDFTITPDMRNAPILTYH